MGEWKPMLWGDAISLEYGKSLRDYKSGKGAIPVFGTNGQVGWTEKHLAPGPGVILGRKGAYRGTHFSERSFFVIDTAYYVKPKIDLDMRWLYYAIIHDKLGEVDDGSPIPSTTRAAVYVRKYLFPPLPEQRAIASVLSALDDKIELNRRMNRTLERQARALFADWFVHFGPTRAKQEARRAAGVTANAKPAPPYLPPELWSLFPDRLNDEGIPEGWEMGTLADIAETNAQSWTAKNHPDKVEYVDLSNTKWGVIESTAALGWKEAPSRARRIARIGDTIVATTRPGNGSFAYISKEGFTASTGFAVLTPRKPIQRDFVYIAATNPKNIKRLANLADGYGGAYPAVKPSAVSDTEVVLPKPELFEAFVEIVSEVRNRIEHNKTESRTLAQTRDLLLPRLMSGELRVAEGEAIVEGVG